MNESGSELTAHLTSGAAIVYGIQWLKTQGWCPWLDEHSTAANRIVSVGGAVIAVMGITFSYDPAVGGDIHIPMLSVLLTGAWEVVKQFTLQQLTYDAIVQKAGANPVDRAGTPPASLGEPAGY